MAQIKGEIVQVIGPVVDADFSDAAELLESVGGGFRLNSPDALLESILYFMDHPEEYETAGRRAREIAVTQQGSAGKQAALVQEVLHH